MFCSLCFLVLENNMCENIQTIDLVRFETTVRWLIFCAAWRFQLLCYFLFCSPSQAFATETFIHIFRIECVSRVKLSGKYWPLTHHFRSHSLVIINHPFVTSLRSSFRLAILIDFIIVVIVIMLDFVSNVRFFMVCLRIN